MLKLKKTWNVSFAKWFTVLVKTDQNNDLVLLLRSMKQEGPEGPGSLTWGKGQRSQWSHLQRTTYVVHQILVEDL